MWTLRCFDRCPAFASLSAKAARIAASVEEWSTAKAGLIYLTVEYRYSNLEEGSFIPLINEELKHNNTQLSNLTLQRLDELVSFETLIYLPSGCIPHKLTV